MKSPVTLPEKLVGFAADLLHQIPEQPVCLTDIAIAADIFQHPDIWARLGQIKKSVGDIFPLSRIGQISNRNISDDFAIPLEYQQLTQI